jgi:hypothetical protein
MDENEKNSELGSSRSFVFVDVFSFRVEDERPAVYRRLVAHLPSRRIAYRLLPFNIATFKPTPVELHNWQFY